MLNGVGGRTIAEAKDNITYSEYIEWVKYRNLRGSFSIPRRVEQAVASMCMMIGNVNGGKKGGQPYSATDFMPHEIMPEPEVDEENYTFAQFVASFNG